MDLLDAKPSFDLSRLIQPAKDKFNDDFLCGICKSKFLVNKVLEILNKPVECANADCGVLFCNYCL